MSSRVDASEGGAAAADLERLAPIGFDTRRANNFNTLRLVMACAVIWSHSFALFRGSEDGEPISRLLNGVYNAGNIAVLAFFAISGFLISQSWCRSSSWKSYLRKRVSRILPGYLVATALCSLVVVPLFSTRSILDFTSGEWAGLASNLLLQNYIVQSDAFGGGAVNGSLWSIPYEFWCYLGVLGLGLAGLFKVRAVFPAIAVIVMLGRVWLDLNGVHPGGGLLERVIGYPYFWFNVLPPFMLGASIYLYRDVIPRSPLIALGLGAAVIAAAHLPISHLGQDIATRLIFPFALTYAIIFIAYSRVHLGDAARFGDFSYGTYLYAFPIQQMLHYSVGQSLPFGVLLIVSVALSILAGAISWFLVEHWFVGGGAKKRPKLAKPVSSL